MNNYPILKIEDRLTFDSWNIINFIVTCGELGVDWLPYLFTYHYYQRNGIVPFWLIRRKQDGKA